MEWGSRFPSIDLLLSFCLTFFSSTYVQLVISLFCNHIIFFSFLARIGSLKVFFVSYLLLAVVFFLIYWKSVQEEIGV